MSYLFRVKRSIKNTVKELSLASAGFAAAGLGFLYFDSHVGAIRAVEGPSMSPTLNPTEYTEEKRECLRLTKMFIRGLLISELIRI